MAPLWRPKMDATPPGRIHVCFSVLCDVCTVVSVRADPTCSSYFNFSRVNYATRCVFAIHERQTSA
eukprot:7972104-Pyramimonas_sp.AAC.1